MINEQMDHGGTPLHWAEGPPVSTGGGQGGENGLDCIRLSLAMFF